MNMPDLRTQSWRGGALARVSAAIVLLALLFGLVIATSEEARAAKAKASEAEGQKPSFVVIQTDDETMEELYQGVRMANGNEEFAMPNTLQMLGEKGITFNRYYTPYSLCAPSRVSLLTGRYAHNNHVQGNVPPNGGWTGFQSRLAYSHNLATWLQGAGYRTIHIGKILNGYGDPPYSPGTEVPPGWSSWHTILNSDTDHYSYGYLMNNNGVVEGPYGNSGSWETREYGEIDDAGCPYAPLNGKPCFYETDKFNQLAAEELAATPAEQPFYMQVDYTSPHGDFRKPAGPQAATRDFGRFSTAPLPDNRAEGFNEGNVNDKPRFIREAPYLSATEIHTYRVYYQHCLECADLGRRRGQRDPRRARRPGPAPEHLRHLHLRQRLLLRPAPPRRRQVPRLRALDPPAADHPRPGDQTGHLDRPAGQHGRHRADDPRTGRSGAGQEHRRRLDGPVHERTDACARGGRCCSSPSSRPTTSNRTARRRPKNRRRPNAPTPGRRPASWA